MTEVFDSVVGIGRGRALVPSWGWVPSLIDAKSTFGSRSLLAAFPDPTTGAFTAFAVDVQLFAGTPYPQHALSPGLVLSGDEGAMEHLQNGAAIDEDSGHCSNNQPGACPNTKGGC